MLVVVFIVASLCLIQPTFGTVCSCETSIDGNTMSSGDLHSLVHNYTSAQKQLSYLAFGNTCMDATTTCDTNKMAAKQNMFATCVSASLDVAVTGQSSVKGTYRDCVFVINDALGTVDNECLSASLGANSIDLCLCRDKDNCNSNFGSHVAASMLVMMCGLILSMKN